MLKRSLLVVALVCGCSPAVLPAAVSSPAEPSANASRVPDDAAFAAVRPHRARRVARLAPPFAASAVTRRVPDGEPTTAVATAD
ncbi:MAG TPA: hypothetical protein VMI54_17520 [Polyangiaceae bacterium]|nr:hypothetical protein [Polyangiaceae bacterium]